MKKFLMLVALVSMAGRASAECITIAMEYGPDGAAGVCVAPTPSTPGIDGVGIGAVTVDGVGAGVGLGTDGTVSAVGTYGGVSGAMSVGPEGSSVGIGIVGTF